MMPRCIRPILLAVLACIALDVADADCLKGLPAGEVACASLDADCACCVLSEAPAVGADSPLLHPPSRAEAVPSGRPRDGIRPVPYRPPLHLS